MYIVSICCLRRFIHILECSRYLRVICRLVYHTAFSSYFFLFMYIHRRKWEDEPFGTGGNFPIVKRIALISLCFICILFWSSFPFVVLFQQLNTRHSLQQWTNSLHSIASKFGDELVNQVRFCCSDGVEIINFLILYITSRKPSPSFPLQAELLAQSGATSISWFHLLVSCHETHLYCTTFVWSWWDRRSHLHSHQIGLDRKRSLNRHCLENRIWTNISSMLSIWHSICLHLSHYWKRLVSFVWLRRQFLELTCLGRSFRWSICSEALHQIHLRFSRNYRALIWKNRASLRSGLVHTLEVFLLFVFLFYCLSRFWVVL